MRGAILLLSAFLLAVASATGGTALSGQDVAAPRDQPSSPSTPQLVLGPGPSTFEVKDGAFRTTKGRGWVHTQETYTDFELEVEFRPLNDKAEAAIAMRVPTLNDPAPTAGYFVALPLPAGNPDVTRIVTTRVQDKAVPSAARGGAAESADADAVPAAAQRDWQRVVVRVDHDTVALSVNGRPLQIVQARGPQTGTSGSSRDAARSNSGCSG